MTAYINTLKAGWRSMMGALILAAAVTACADDDFVEQGGFDNSGVSITLSDVGTLPSGYAAGDTAKTRVATTYDPDATDPAAAVKSTWAMGDEIMLQLMFTGTDGENYGIGYYYISGADGEAPKLADDKTEAYTFANGTSSTIATNLALIRLKGAVQAGGDGAVTLIVGLSSVADATITNIYGKEVIAPSSITLNGTALTGSTVTDGIYTASIPMTTIQPYAGSDLTSQMNLKFAITKWERRSALAVLTGGKGYSVKFYMGDNTEPALTVPTTGTMGDGTYYVHLTPGTYRVERSDASGKTAYINPGGEAGYTFAVNTYYVLDVTKEVITPGASAVPGQDYTYESTTNTFTVFSGEGLAAAANAINNGTLTVSRADNPYANANIILGCDINMNKIGYTPIGTADNPYTGTFDGKGYTISNLTITVTDDGVVGLIANLGAEGSLTDVTVKGACTITTAAHLVGVSALVNSGKIYAGTDITIGGDIDMSSVNGYTPIGNDENPYTGTFDGDNHKISNLNIIGEGKAGLFGTNGGTVKDVNIDGINIEGGTTVGAIAGDNQGAISKCTVSGIAASGNSVKGLIAAGIAGFNSGTVTECKVTDVGITSNGYCGGIVAQNLDEASITKCIVNGSTTITGGSATGGIVGYNDGGTIGGSAENANRIYIDPTTGITDAICGSNNIVNSSGIVSYNYVDDSAMATGYVSSTDDEGNTTYTVYTAKGLRAISTDINGGTIADDGNGMTFKLGVDIDFGVESYNPIDVFKGTFNGAKPDGKTSYTISNLIIKGGEKIGLIGENKGKVMNVILIDAKIEGSNYVGAIVGYNDSGEIKYCKVSGGTVSGSKYVGAIAGYKNDGVINNSNVSNCTVSGSEYVGATAGYQYLGKIFYGNASGGTVSGSKYIGGIVGGNQSEVKYGIVSGVTIKGDDTVGGIVGYNNVQSHHEVGSNDIKNCIIGNDDNDATNVDIFCGVGSVSGMVNFDSGGNKINGK